MREPSLWVHPEVDHRVAGGCAWGAAALAALVFAIGAVVLAYVIVTGESGAYGLVGVFGALLSGLGIALLGVAAVLWTVHRVRRRSSPHRTAAALVALAGAIVLLLPLTSDFLGVIVPSGETWPPSVAGGLLLVLAAVLAAERSERRPAVVFAALSVLLVGTYVYRTSTDLRVEVVWLGASVVNRTPGQVGFTATRSGDFEVRFDAPFCWTGRVIATGRYEWRPSERNGPTYGATTFVDLPSDILPLKSGDLVRVCIRDGLAAGTGAGEGGDSSGFFSID